jgi:hypothetical protein
MIALLPNHSKSAHYVKQMSKGGILVHKLIPQVKSQALSKTQSSRFILQNISKVKHSRD